MPIEVRRVLIPAALGLAGFFALYTVVTASLGEWAWFFMPQGGCPPVNGSEYIYRGLQTGAEWRTKEPICLQEPYVVGVRVRLSNVVRDVEAVDLQNFTGAVKVVRYCLDWWCTQTGEAAVVDVPIAAADWPPLYNLNPPAVEGVFDAIPFTPFPKWPPNVVSLYMYAQHPVTVDNSNAPPLASMSQKAAYVVWRNGSALVPPAGFTFCYPPDYDVSHYCGYADAEWGYSQGVREAMAPRAPQMIFIFIASAYVGKWGDYKAKYSAWQCPAVWIDSSGQVRSTTVYIAPNSTQFPDDADVYEVTVAYVVNHVTTYPPGVYKATRMTALEAATGWRAASATYTTDMARTCVMQYRLYSYINATVYIVPPSSLPLYSLRTPRYWPFNRGWTAAPKSIDMVRLVEDKWPDKTYLRISYKTNYLQYVVPWFNCTVTASSYGLGPLYAVSGDTLRYTGDILPPLASLVCVGPSKSEAVQGWR